MFDWLYAVPFWLGALLFVVVLVGVSWLAIAVSRRYVTRIAEGERDWDMKLGAMIAAYGVIYGITLALIAVSAYSNYSSADNIASREAAALGTLYREVSGYPEPAKTQLTGLLRAYTDEIITVEWPMQQEGLTPGNTDDPIGAFQQALLAVEPQTDGDLVLHSNAIEQFGAFIDLHRQRLGATNLGLPTPMWFVVVMGALLSMVLISLFDIKRRSVHLLVAGMVSMFVALLLFATASLDHPFRGPLSVTPQAFELIQRTLMSR